MSRMLHIVALAYALIALQSYVAYAGKLKVFVLAGQSNSKFRQVLRVLLVQLLALHVSAVFAAYLYISISLRINAARMH